MPGGSHHVTTDLTCWPAAASTTGRYRGRAARWCGPARLEKVAGSAAGVPGRWAYVTVQGGRTSLVGTVPNTTCCCLPNGCVVAMSMPLVRRIGIGAGVTLAAVQHAASTAGAGVRRGFVGPEYRDRRWHGLDERQRIARSVTATWASRLSARRPLPDGGAAPAQPGASRQHRLTTCPRCSSGPKAPWGVITALDLRLRLRSHQGVSKPWPRVRQANALVDASQCSATWRARGVGID